MPTPTIRLFQEFVNAMISYPMICDFEQLIFEVLPGQIEYNHHEWYITGLSDHFLKLQSITTRGAEKPVLLFVHTPDRIKVHCLWVSKGDLYAAQRTMTTPDQYGCDPRV